MQVGYVGLLKAINNFDPALGFSLATYARPCITGEIKKHFRDKSWQVHVERQLQERVLEVRQATHRLTQQLGRMPADSELASDLGIGDADIREARQAELVLQPLSLDEPLNAAGPARPAWLNSSARKTPGSSTCSACRRSPGTGPNCRRVSSRSWCCITTGGMTQAQIGQQLGLSQMQVSRLLARALGYLRPRLFGQPEYATDAVLAVAGHRAGLAPPGRLAASRERAFSAGA